MNYSKSLLVKARYELQEGIGRWESDLENPLTTEGRKLEINECLKIASVLLEDLNDAILLLS